MLHFLPEPAATEICAPYAEAVARLAGLRHALRIVDPAARSASINDEELAFAWSNSSEAAKRCFDQRSTQATAAVASGLEAMLATGDTSEAARKRIAAEIRASLDDLSRLMRG